MVLGTEIYLKKQKKVVTVIPIETYQGLLRID